MSLVSLLFAAVPEIVFFCLIILTMAGYKISLPTDNRKQTFMKMLKFCGICVASFFATILLKMLIKHYAGNFIGYLIFNTFLFTLYSKKKWYNIAISIMVYFPIFSITEFSTFKLGSMLTGITLEQCAQNPTLATLMFAPLHILQALAFFVMYKFNFSFPAVENISTYTKMLRKKLTLINIALFGGMCTVLLTVKVFAFDITGQTHSELITIWINIASICALCGVMNFTSTKFIKAINEEKKNKVIQLAWFKTLVDKNDISEVKKQIKEAADKKEA